MKRRRFFAAWCANSKKKSVAPWAHRAAMGADGGVETWSYCADCRAQAMVEIVEVEDADL
jgi:hypothetical protein